MKEITARPEDDPDTLAFASVMIDLNGCIARDARRYRVRGGCASCAGLTLKASTQISEAILIGRFHAAQKRMAESPATK